MTGPPRVLVIGSGPIGSFLAARLSEGGAAVTLHGLGTGFLALAKRGSIDIRDSTPGASVRSVPLSCSVRPPEPGGWDVVIFAVKAQDLGIASREFSAHTQDASVVLPQNGLPWWQFLGDASPTRLESVDPGGTIEASLALHSIAGCVITKGLAFDEGGTLIEVSVPSDSFVLGDVVTSSRASERPFGCFQAAGLPVRMVPDIRTEKWRKLLINVAFNPLGALSHLRFGEVLDEVEGEFLAMALMNEALSIAKASGLEAEVDIANAFARARSSRTHKTSMLQDVEAGRPLEIDPIIGVLLELAAVHKCETTTLSLIYACLKLVNASLAKGPIRQARRVL